jgi:hypothetical protein
MHLMRSTHLWSPIVHLSNGAKNYYLPLIKTRDQLFNPFCFPINKTHMQPKFVPLNHMNIQEIKYKTTYFLVNTKDDGQISWVLQPRQGGISTRAPHKSSTGASHNLQFECSTKLLLQAVKVTTITRSYKLALSKFDP